MQNPINMSADERREEQVRLANLVETAKAAAKRAKEELKACKAALKAAKTDEEKTTATEACQAAEQKVKDTTAKVTEAAAEEKTFRGAVAELENKETEAADPFLALAKQYAKHYPDCDTFHITTDRQVFLDGNKSLAAFHQRSLGGGEVRTIKVR